MKKIFHTLLGTLFVSILFLWVQEQSLTEESTLTHTQQEGSGVWGLRSGKVCLESEVDVMEKNTGIEPSKSPSEVITRVLDKFQVDLDCVAIAYYDFEAGEHFYLNEDKVAYAASTTKVAIAALFADLVNQGIIQWDTELPYDDSYFEEGDGFITNSEKVSSYPVEELIMEMLTHSDNTATNILTYAYINQYSGSFARYREAIVRLSGFNHFAPEVYSGNYATAEMLEQTLIHIATDEDYSFITDIMLDSQNGFRLKQYISEGMAAKYGSNGAWQHDTAIYYKDGIPDYVIVVLTNGIPDVDEFMGTLNLRLYEWQQTSLSS